VIIPDVIAHRMSESLSPALATVCSNSSARPVFRTWFEPWTAVSFTPILRDPFPTTARAPSRRKTRELVVPQSIVAKCMQSIPSVCVWCAVPERPASLFEEPARLQLRFHMIALVIREGMNGSRGYASHTPRIFRRA